MVSVFNNQMQMQLGAGSTVNPFIAGAAATAAAETANEIIWQITQG